MENIGIDKDEGQISNSTSPAMRHNLIVSFFNVHKRQTADQNTFLF